jgi:type I restriction enzyme S subunit
MAEWQQTTFNELVTRRVLSIGDGHRAKLDELGGTGPLFLRAGALTDRGFDWSGLDSFRADMLDGLGPKIGHVGDVVITTKGNSLGRVGWVPPDSPTFVYSPHLSYWRSLDHDALVPRYLYYWARSEAFGSQLRRLAYGTDMAPYFSLRDQAQLRIGLPSPEKQRAIAEVLGALDDKIAANDRQAKLATDLADAEFARAANKVAQSRGIFGDLADVGGGGTPKTSVDEYWNGDVSWATPTDVTGLAGPYLGSTERTITDDGLAACSSKLYPEGSILMTSRSTIGAFAIAQQPIAVNQDFIVVNAHNSTHQWWLFHEMRSRVADFISHANGATFLELSRGKFKEFRVRLPGREQARAFSEAVEPLHGVAAQSLRENLTLAATRDELLPLLMSGQLRVRAAENIVGSAT